MKLIAYLATTMLLISCGTDNDSQNVNPAQDNAQNVQQITDEAVKSEMVLARVPVDANGNEQTEKIETVMVNNSQKLSNESSLQSAFENGQELGLDNTELDSDSSTDSHYRRYPRCNCRRGYWVRGNNFGYNWWGRSPWVSNNGGFYSFNYYRTYSFPRYRYYSYRFNRQHFSNHRYGRRHGGSHYRWGNNRYGRVYGRRW